MRRYRMRADKNAREIDKALRAVGATVEPIHGKRGTPDRLVGYCCWTFLLEYKSKRALKKDGTIGLSDRITTEAQGEWREKWMGGPVHVVSTPEEALSAIGVDGMFSPEVVAARRPPRRTPR